MFVLVEGVFWGGSEFFVWGVFVGFMLGGVFGVKEVGL